MNALTSIKQKSHLDNFRKITKRYVYFYLLKIRSIKITNEIVVKLYHVDVLAHQKTLIDCVDIAK